MRSMPYEQYFGEMDLTDEQLRERLLFSLKFENSVLSALTKVEVIHKYDELNNLTTQAVADELARQYEELYADIAEADEEIKKYISAFALSVIATTLDHIDEEYYTSYDRARLITENEANTSINYADFSRARNQGYTHKTWKTMEDPAVRQTHREVANETIPIGDYFVVGNSMMRYPKDLDGINVTGEEVVNCRCTITYT